MADLEDKIFKQNVPGRTSTHEGSSSEVRPADRLNTDEYDEDEDDGNGDGMPKTDDAETLEYARGLAAADIPETVRRSILAQRDRDKKTGVKGVLADYKEAAALAEAQNIADAEQKARVIKRIVEGYKIKAEDEPVQEQEVFDVHADLGDGYGDDDDDGFMREYRHKRLAELQVLTQALPTFGRVRDVSSEEFLDEVDSEDRRVFVVVHLFEPSVLSCIRMNRLLEEIAHTHRNVKFLRMHASVNEIEVDRMTLPILTVYKGGETVAVHAGIAAELGEHFKKADVDWLLEECMEEQP
jgi:hypothetical protein